MLNSFEHIQKSVQDSAALSTKSLGAIGEAWQAIASEAADYSKRSFEEGSAVLETLMASKDAGAVFELQSSYAKRAYDGYVGEMTKLGAIVSDLAKGMAKPYEAMFSAFK